MSGGKLRWRSEFLRPTGVAVIAERVLHNLAGCYGRAHDEAGRFRVLTFLSALRPDEPENFLQRAEVAEELGVRDLAQQVYAEIVERFPETQQALTAIDRLTEGDGSDVPSPLVN
jgi:regulator of sirC expression with transglutaminase-like and TPR domain